MQEKQDVWQGTLALMVLRTLAVLGPQHGYGIAKRIEQISADMLAVNHGTLYPVLMRLSEQGLLESRWQDPERPGLPPRHVYRLTAPGLALALEQAGNRVESLGLIDTGEEDWRRPIETQ